MRLPTFLIAGAMRSGTTSLNAYLRQHPDVSVSQPKEVHFFDTNFTKGVDWYLQHFPDSDDSVAVGEATPDYMYHPEAMERLNETLPDSRILILLRDPVDRAYSHYWHNRSRGKEDLPFGAALDAETERIRDQGSPDRAVYSYVDRGQYFRQLNSMLSRIARERVLIQTFDELTADPAAVYKRTCRFIGVSDDFIPDLLGDPVNAFVEFRSKTMRNLTKALPKKLRDAVGRLNMREDSTYEPISDEAAERIRELTRSDSQQLEDLLGQPVPWI